MVTDMECITNAIKYDVAYNGLSIRILTVDLHLF